MILPHDDQLGHQTVEYYCKPAVADTPHAMFTERFWYMGTIVPQGDFVFNAGLGYYANRQIMDGYVGISRQGVQYNFRASRHSGDDPLATHIGPLRISILQGLDAHRIELLPNDSGLTLDLRFTASLPPNDEGRDRVVRGGETIADVLRYVQFGHYTGYVEWKGQRTEIGDNECWGVRDRSWGLRTEARTDESSPPVTRFKPMLWFWICAQFEGRGIHLFLKEDAPGKVRSLVANETYAGEPHGNKSGRASRDIVKVEHELEWREDEYAQRLLGGVLKLVFEDGETKTLRMRVLPGLFSLKAGMYGGYEGWFQGDDKGALHTEHDTWNLSDPAVRKRLRSLADHVVEFTDGNEIGYGTFQGGVAAGYPKYEQIQGQPMM